jgi:hypothetical protein
LSNTELGAKKIVKVVPVEQAPGDSQIQAIAKAAVKPSLNAALALDAYQDTLLGRDIEVSELIEALRVNMREVNDGNMTTVEAMLVGQATALQTIFASLARRAQMQTGLKQYETFLNLALKAQSQSRTTIQALAELKFPRHSTFVRQANIANGPQQVNNGPIGQEGVAPAGPTTIAPTELLKESTNEVIGLVPGAPKTAGGADSRLEPVEAFDRPENRRRKAQGIAEPVSGGRTPNASSARGRTARPATVARG